MPGLCSDKKKGLREGLGSRSVRKIGKEGKDSVSGMGIRVWGRLRG
jgi:hypothetical protein